MKDPEILDEYREIANFQKNALNRQKAVPLLAKLLRKLFNRAYLAFINYFDFSSGSETTFTQANEFKKLVTSTSSAYDWESFTHTNNRVTNYEYTKNVKLEGIVSAAGNNNEEVHAAFFKNDEIIPCSEQSAVTSSGGKAPNIAIQCITTMNPNDYVEVWVKNSTSNHPVTLHNINVIVTEL